MVPGQVPNCGVDSWEAPHHPLLQAAIMAGCVMVVQGIGEKEAQTHLCWEDVQVAGLSGGCTVVDFHHMMPVVDGDDRVRVVKAMGVDSIAALGANKSCFSRIACRPC